jgi:hypothetical protein
VSAAKALAHVGARLVGAGALGAAIGGLARRAQGALALDLLFADTLDLVRDVATRPVWDAAGVLMASLPVHAPELRLAIAGGATLAGALVITIAARRRTTGAAAAGTTAPVAPPPTRARVARAIVRPATRVDAATFLSQVEAAARAVDRLGVSAPRPVRAGAARTAIGRARARVTAVRTALGAALDASVAALRRPRAAAGAPGRPLAPGAAHTATGGAARRPALVSPLAESGATRAEIARRTGLSRDAVALSLSITARQV